MLHMIRQDLIELHQLINLYKNTYPNQYDQEASILLEDISMKYRVVTGKPIESAANPRCAGRRHKYDQDMNNRILRLAAEGNSIRTISAKTGCSVGYIQNVRKSRCSEINF